LIFQSISVFLPAPRFLYTGYLFFNFERFTFAHDGAKLFPAVVCLETENSN